MIAENTNVSASVTGPETAPLVLASASRSRAELLRAAGVVFTVDPAAVDEAEVKRAMAAEHASPLEVADALASLKACRVSQRYNGALVLGADQMLVCGNDWFDKPGDVAEARVQLGKLRGRAHELVTAASVARNGGVVWRANQSARLTMREFSDGFLETYLQAVGPEVTETVGGYRIEGLGIQLFAAIAGDHATILGLPLLPLLDFLRGHGIVAA